MALCCPSPEMLSPAAILQRQALAAPECRLMSLGRTMCQTVRSHGFYKDRTGPPMATRSRAFLSSLKHTGQRLRRWAGGEMLQSTSGEHIWRSRDSQKTAELGNLQPGWEGTVCVSPTRHTNTYFLPSPLGPHCLPCHAPLLSKS